MPELKEFAPVVFPEPERQFAPVDFSLGQGRSEQKFVPENNSTVNMPVTSSASFDSREAKEFIDGEEGLWGNTPLGNLFAAPGGVIDPNILNDLRKLPGGIVRTAFETAIGSLGEAVALALEEREVVEVEGLGVIPPLTSGLDRFIQNNPELAQRFNEKMLDLQEANEKFLIRNGLIYGPDDQPTILGNALSQAGTSGSAIALAVLFKNPALAAGIFGVIQQVSGFQEAEEAGKEPSEAAAIGTLQGIIEAGVSFIGVNKLTKIIGSKSAGIVGKIIASMATEGIEEGVTEALIIAVQKVTGVKDISLGEALLQIFQATFYGALLGAGTTATITTSQAVVKRIVGDSVSEADTDKVARVMDNVGSETATEIIEQDIDDATTELEIDKDLASDQPVTKAAKTTGEQQKRVVEIMQQVNEGKEIDLPALLDEIFPEARIQRQKQILEESKVASIQQVAKEAIRREVVQLQAEIQIAEQQGDEDLAAEKSERIEQLRQQTFADESLQEAAEELEAEGIFPRGEEFFEKAAADIENVLRPLRAGERLGRTLQKEEGRALRKSLTKIIKGLGKKDKSGAQILTDKKLLVLQQKVDEVETIANAERIRRDILSQARKSAVKKIISDRRIAINKTIKKTAEVDKGVLDPDSQNAVDSMNKMRKGMISAAEVKDLPPVKKQTDEQKEQAKATRIQQVADFNAKQSERIQDDMGQGIPAEGVVLQVRYLDILNEKSKATPQQVASFEDDLNAFIETGKGRATVADAADQKLINATRRQGFSNEIKDFRADVRNSTLVSASETVDFFLRTHNTAVRMLGLQGTVFDLFNEEVIWRRELQLRREDMRALAERVAPNGNGAKYLSELQGKTANVIDVARKGHTAETGGFQSGRLQWTRGQLISAAMLLEQENIAKQIRDPKGEMAWTDKLVRMIDERLTDQDRDFIAGLFEMYSQSYERFNAAYRAIYNRDLTRVEFYSHIAREGKDGQDKSAHTETVLIDSLAVPATEGEGESLIFPARKPKEAIVRVDASSEIKILNVVEVFNNYNYDVEHFIAMGKKLSLQDKLLREKEFSKHLREILGRGGFNNFIEHVKIIARSNQRAKHADQALRDLFELLRANFFKKTLLANPKIGLGQTASVLAGKAGVPTGNFIASVIDYSTNPKKVNAFLNRHPTFSSRELNFNPEIDQVGEFNKLLKFLNLPSRKGDGWAARASAWAQIEQMMRDGVSEEEALRRGAEFAEGSQQSTLLTQRTLAQKSDNPYVRSMTMFTSSPTAMVNVSIVSIVEYRQADKSTPKKKSAAYNKMIEILAIQNLYIPALYSFLTGRSFVTIIGGSLGGAPIIGGSIATLGTIFLNVLREDDERVFIEGILDDIPLSRFTRDVYRAANRLSKGDLSMEDYLTVTVPIVEALFGLPIDNVMDMIKGTVELFDTDDPLDAVLQMGNYGDAARERTIKRFDALTPGETTPGSGKIPNIGASGL